MKASDLIHFHYMMSGLDILQKSIIKAKNNLQRF